MVRRSFRIGLRLGLFFGVTFALVKTIQSRRTAAAVPPPAPWEPLAEEPRGPAAEVVVDEVGEPILEPSAPAPDWSADPLDPAEPMPDVPAAAEAPAPATPPEGDLLNAKAAPDPALDVIPGEATAPVKKVAARKLPAAKKAAAPRKAAAKKAAKKAALPRFVEPEGGVCPPTHPVKAKLASRLFHLPGMFAYDRTRPDRCYLDGSAAVADGFTQAKR